MSWAAKISPTAIGGAALGGYVVRLAVILVALVLLRHRLVDLLPRLGFTHRRHPPRVAVLGDAYVSSRSLRRASPEPARILTGDE